MNGFRNQSLVIPTIIAINIGVFLFWNFFGENTIVFMMQNFLVSWTALMQGRVWTLITSVFSHNMFFHIFINMFVLNSFGSVIEGVLGTKSFLKFYFVAGVISSLCHSMVSASLLDRPDLPALGASGAISGLVALFALLFPKQILLIFGLIPVPALFGAIAFVALDVWGLVEQVGGGGLPIGHGAHIGGALTGVLYYFLILQSRRRRWQRQFRSP